MWQAVAFLFRGRAGSFSGVSGRDRFVPSEGARLFLDSKVSITRDHNLLLQRPRFGSSGEKREGVFSTASAVVGELKYSNVGGNLELKAVEARTPSWNGKRSAFSLEAVRAVEEAQNTQIRLFVVPCSCRRRFQVNRGGK